MRIACKCKCVVMFGCCFFFFVSSLYLRKITLIDIESIYSINWSAQFLGCFSIVLYVCVCFCVWFFFSCLCECVLVTYCFSTLLINNLFSLSLLAVIGKHSLSWIQIHWHSTVLFYVYINIYLLFIFIYFFLVCLFIIVLLLLLLS